MLATLAAAVEYTGDLSADGSTIRGAWEDGATWEHDFDPTCTDVV